VCESLWWSLVSWIPLCGRKEEERSWLDLRGFRSCSALRNKLPMIWSALEFLLDLQILGSVVLLLFILFLVAALCLLFVHQDPRWYRAIFFFSAVDFSRIRSTLRIPVYTAQGHYKSAQEQTQTYMPVTDTDMPGLLRCHIQCTTIWDCLCTESSHSAVSLTRSTHSSCLLHDNFSRVAYATWFR